MIKLEINDKVYKIPESFDEMTLEQYCKVFYKIDNDITSDEDEVTRYKRQSKVQAAILSRILGEDDDFCLDLPINVYSQLLDRTKFIYDNEFLKKVSKAGITIKGKRYSVPPFNEMPLRQYIDADVILKDKENPLQFIELLSVLLTPKDKDGKWIPYNGDYQEVFGNLRGMSCTDTLGLVYHFFKKGEALRRISSLSMKVEESQRHLSTASS